MAGTERPINTKKPFNIPIIKARFANHTVRAKKGTSEIVSYVMCLFVVSFFSRLRMTSPSEKRQWQLHVFGYFVIITILYGCARGFDSFYCSM